MWTNHSIISVTATPVGNCICRYQSEKAGTVIRNNVLNVDSTRLDTTLPYFTKHSNSTQHVNTRPDPTPPNLPTLPCFAAPHLTRKMSESLGEGRMRCGGSVEFGGTGQSSLVWVGDGCWVGWNGVGWGGVG